MQISGSKTRIGWVFFLIGLVLIVLTSWPLPAQTIEWSSTSDAASYTFTLDWPALVRIGENHQAELTVTRKGSFSNDSIFSEVLESRLEFNNLQVDPSGMVTQPLGSTGMNEFRWSIKVWQAGQYSGTLWIYTASLEDAGVHRALTARSLEIRSVGPGRSIVLILRWTGVLLVLLGALFVMHPLLK